MSNLWVIQRDVGYFSEKRKCRVIVLESRTTKVGRGHAMGEYKVTIIRDGGQ